MGSNLVNDAAVRLERHIRACSLNPGDRYISADEAARLLKSSTMTAQRAMNLLAKRGILTRRPKAGTFIGEALATTTALSCVHFLLPDQFMTEDQTRESYWARIHGEIHGMRQVLAGLSVQFNFIPNQDLAYTKQIVSQLPVSGAVLVLSSREMRAYFDASGIPTVVDGSVESDLTNLCWIDWDQVQTGRLLASYLLARGHRNFATMMRSVWSIGEHALHDGISEAMAQAGLAATALRIRSAPPEDSAIAELTLSLLKREENPPTGFICRTEFQAECVARVVNEVGLASKVEIVICQPPRAANAHRFACVTPELEPVEQGKIIGQMLQSLMLRDPIKPRGRRIPVRLCPLT